MTPPTQGRPRCLLSRSISASWPSTSSINEPAAELLARYTGRLKSDPNDADASHHRALALANVRRYPEAIDDLTQAIRLRRDDARPRAMRAAIYESLHRYEPAIADLEAVLARTKDQPAIRERLGNVLQ